MSCGAQQVESRQILSPDIETPRFEPLVSIIIPVYNGADYLAQAIDSALAQTYSRCEVLVVNDGSRDDGATQRVALGYGSRIRYFSQPNGGVSTALNTGIREMRGEYFSWLSHDDLYEPDKVSTQIAWLADHPEARRDGLVFSDYQEIDQSGSVLKSTVVGELPSPVRDMYWRLLVTYPVNGCTLLIPRAVFAEAGQFDPNLRTTQDYDLWFRFARRYTFHYLPRTLVRFRVHPAQGSKSIDVHRRECTELYVRALQGLNDDELSEAGGERGAAWGYLAAARSLCFGKRMFEASRAALRMAIPRSRAADARQRVRLWCELRRLQAATYLYPAALATYRRLRSP